MTPFQPWGWHYRVRAPKWLAAVSLLLLSLHATTSLGLGGLETADFLERADPDRFLINNLNNIGGEEGMTVLMIQPLFSIILDLDDFVSAS